MARVQVILTSYNRPRMVQKSINSVLKQIWGDFTLYIMDGNSREHVKQILRRYEKNPHVKLFFSKEKNADRMKRCGYAVEINRALRMGKEPLITYLTDDAGMYPNKLYDMVYWMDHHPNLNVCYGNQKVLRNGVLLFGRGGHAIVTHPAGHLDHNQIMFRRQILEKVGYWTEDASHMGDKDAVWFISVVRHDYKFYPVKTWTDWLIFHPKRLTDLLVHGKHNQIKDGSLRE